MELQSNATGTSNLLNLQKATSGMDSEDWRSFVNFFMGSLSIQVPRRNWNHALEIARYCMEKYKAPEKKA